MGIWENLFVFFITFVLFSSPVCETDVVLQSVLVLEMFPTSITGQGKILQMHAVYMFLQIT